MNTRNQVFSIARETEFGEYKYQDIDWVDDFVERNVNQKLFNHLDNCYSLFRLKQGEQPEDF